MKAMLKLTLAFALGAAVTAAIAIPNLAGQRPVPQTLETGYIQEEIAEAADAAAEKALADKETAAIAKPEQIEVKAVEQPEAQAEQAASETPPPAREAEEVRDTPEAKEEPAPAPSPQAGQTRSEYPKEFYIDGQKYAYLTEYAEEMGYKTFIAPDDEPNATQSGYYDWENDPNGKIPGPFNGNGSTGGD
jgi:outer membrane biosynthesis protein TonB